MSGEPTSALPSAQIRPRLRFAWRGPSLLAVDSRGECGVEPFSGYYFREARHLSRLKLTIDGGPPYLCTVGGSAPHELDLVFIHPELHEFGGGGSGLSGQEALEHTPGTVPPRSVDLRLRYQVHPASLEAVLLLGNRSLDAVDLAVAWELAADFRDLQEANGEGAATTGDRVDTLLEEGGLRFRCATAGLPLETRISASGGGRWSVDRGRLGVRVSLPPGASRELVLRVEAVDHEDPIDDAGARRREEALAEWQASVARVEGPGTSLVPSLINRSMAELGSLALLDGSEDEWLTPSAGIPLYPALFGRDALTAGWQASMLDGGQLIEASLASLARLQGLGDDPERDEEPGRIIQQARRGPLARTGQNPFGRYYGDFASPLVFLIALGQRYAWTGDRDMVARHWDAARRILDWAREYGDRDGDGYLEYLTRSSVGPVHQGWKDSGDSLVHPDGRPVSAPAAVCEVQGYYYVAQQFMAVLSAVMGDRSGAVSLWRDAKALKQRFNRDFWMAEEGFLALALDARGSPVRTIASNAGQCLATGIVSDEHVGPLVRRLFQPDLFSGWGIRTLSSANPAYNPLSYHRGSVWPVENGTIVFGLRRFGFVEETARLGRALIDLATVFPDFRVPECVGGYSREEFPHPGSYPRANAPQGWNLSTHPLLLQSLLGLYPAAPLRLLLVDPALPPWLPEVTIRDLRIGEARVTLRFRRDGDGESHVEVVERTGTLRVVRQPSPDALGVGLRDRLAALLRRR